MRGKIWINVPDGFDIHIITDGLERNGFTYCRSFVGNTDEDGAIAACQGCIGVISGMEPWNERTLAAVSGHIKMIIRYGSGYNNIDLAAASRNGIAIFNAAGRNAPAVAEIALLHILNAGRKFTIGVEMARRSEWGMSDLDSFELDGKVVGLYGAGNIAQNLARMLAGFKVELLVYDIVQNDKITQYGATFVDSPEELFRRSDIVSIHIPLTEKTRGTIDRHFFSLMKPSATLVNTSRGPLVNEADLLEFLKAKKIRAAGLDVLCHEPIRGDDPLVLQENAYVTTHMAATSYEAKVRVEECLYQTVTEFFDGKYEKEYPMNYINPPLAS